MDTIKTIQNHTILSAFTSVGTPGQVKGDYELLTALQGDLQALNTLPQTPVTAVARKLVSATIMYVATGDDLHKQAASGARDALADCFLAGGGEK